MLSRLGWSDGLAGDRVVGHGLTPPCHRPPSDAASSAASNAASGIVTAPEEMYPQCIYIRGGACVFDCRNGGIPSR